LLPVALSDVNSLISLLIHLLFGSNLAQLLQNFNVKNEIHKEVYKGYSNEKRPGVG
jgi:hypothetical protein